MNIHTRTLSRRRFLRLCGQGALLTALPVALRADEENVVTISILHTTDLHGHILPTTDYDDHADLGGLARCATQIRQWQRANPNSVLIDVGDVYQGTEFGLRTGGATMIRCLNALAYDAWVVGNHEFDWSADVFTDAVALSSMPVLSGNALLEGKRVGTLDASAGPLSKMRPYFVKQVAGIRIAIIGLTTPALSSWLPPENLRGIEMLDPVETLRDLLREVNAAKPDAIVLAGHMGLTRRDDYANRIGALTREFPHLVACIGGHTHQNHSSDMVNNVLYTQADHFGIYAGKVDLIFDRTSRRLLQREAVTVRMDHQIPLDALVLSLAQADLGAADRVMAREMGELTARFDIVQHNGGPSDVERLIGSAMISALREQGTEVDFVAHGLFDDKHPMLPGMKTIADAWAVLPYENEMVTFEASHDDLVALAADFSSGREIRHLMKVQEKNGPSGAVFDAALPLKAAYRIAVNSYDSQSGGQRFPVLAKMVADPAHHRVLHRLQTRDALIAFFLARRKVGITSLLV